MNFDRSTFHLVEGRYIGDWERDEDAVNVVTAHTVGFTFMVRCDPTTGEVRDAWLEGVEDIDLSE